MGAAHSRARPGAGPAARFAVQRPNSSSSLLKPSAGGGSKVQSNNFGYFILCIKGGDRIKVVNASNPVLKMVGAVVRKHFVITRCGWDRHLAYSYRLQTSNNNLSRHNLISTTAEILLTLYRAGWEPMTPVDMVVKKGKAQNQTAICFRRETPEPEVPDHCGRGGGPHWNVDTPLSASFEDMMQLEHKECLCLETYGKNVLGFHDVPNTLLMDLVQCVQAEWIPGIFSMSNAVSSVISDYATGLDNIRIDDEIDDRRYLRLHGHPWSTGAEEGADLEDAICAENLVISIVACLARAQYKLQISIQMSAATTVFFFIKDSGCRDVRLPTFCGVGLGEKDGLYVYRPTIVRTQTSFFRSRNGRSGKSIRQRLKKSFRRKSSSSSSKERQKKASVASTSNLQVDQPPGVALGLSQQQVEEAAEEVALARKPTVKLNKRLRKFLAASDTEVETDQEDNAPAVPNDERRPSARIRPPVIKFSEA